jgi:TatD DNase family protein
LAETLALLRRYARQLPIMMHCFTGTPQEAMDCLELGESVYISLAGPVTYKNAHERHQVASIVPLNRLLVETDCPFLTPHPFRGRRNEPAYVRFVAEKIAEIKAISYDEVVQITGENVKELFGIQ